MGDKRISKGWRSKSTTTQKRTTNLSRIKCSASCRRKICALEDTNQELAISLEETRARLTRKELQLEDRTNISVMDRIKMLEFESNLQKIIDDFEKKDVMLKNVIQSVQETKVDLKNMLKDFKVMLEENTKQVALELKKCKSSQSELKKALHEKAIETVEEVAEPEGTPSSFGNAEVEPGQDENFNKKIVNNDLIMSNGKTEIETPVHQNKYVPSSKRIISKIPTIRDSIKNKSNLPYSLKYKQKNYLSVKESNKTSVTSMKNTKKNRKTFVIQKQEQGQQANPSTYIENPDENAKLEKTELSCRRKTFVVKALKKNLFEPGDIQSKQNVLNVDSMFQTPIHKKEKTFLVPHNKKNDISLNNNSYDLTDKCVKNGDIFCAIQNSEANEYIDIIEKNHAGLTVNDNISNIVEGNLEFDIALPIIVADTAKQDKPLSDGNGSSNNNIKVISENALSSADNASHMTAPFNLNNKTINIEKMSQVNLTFTEVPSGSNANCSQTKKSQEIKVTDITEIYEHSLDEDSTKLEVASKPTLTSNDYESDIKKSSPSLDNETSNVDQIRQVEGATEITSLTNDACSEHSYEHASLSSDIEDKANFCIDDVLLDVPPMKILGPRKHISELRSKRTFEFHLNKSNLKNIQKDYENTQINKELGVKMVATQGINAKNISKAVIKPVTVLQHSFSGMTDDNGKVISTTLSSASKNRFEIPTAHEKIKSCDKSMHDAVVSKNTCDAPHSESKKGKKKESINVDAKDEQGKNCSDKSIPNVADDVVCRKFKAINNFESNEESITPIMNNAACSKSKTKQKLRLHPEIINADVNDFPCNKSKTLSKFDSYNESIDAVINDTMCNKYNTEDKLIFHSEDNPTNVTDKCSKYQSRKRKDDLDTDLAPKKSKRKIHKNDLECEQIKNDIFNSEIKIGNKRNEKEEKTLTTDMEPKECEIATETIFPKTKTNSTKELTTSLKNSSKTGEQKNTNSKTKQKSIPDVPLQNALKKLDFIHDDKAGHSKEQTVNENKKTVKLSTESSLDSINNIGEDRYLTEKETNVKSKRTYKSKQKDAKPLAHKNMKEQTPDLVSNDKNELCKEKMKKGCELKNKNGESCKIPQKHASEEIDFDAIEDIKINNSKEKNKRLKRKCNFIIHYKDEISFESPDKETLEQHFPPESQIFQHFPPESNQPKNKKDKKGTQKQLNKQKIKQNKQKKQNLLGIQIKTLPLKLDKPSVDDLKVDIQDKENEAKNKRMIKGVSKSSNITGEFSCNYLQDGYSNVNDRIKKASKTTAKNRAKNKENKNLDISFSRSFVVEAEVHSPPSSCVKENSNIEHNKRLSVVLNDLCSEDIQSLSISNKEDLTNVFNKRVLKNRNSDTYMNPGTCRERSSDIDGNLPRSRSTKIVTYKEPPMNRKMRR